MWEEDAGKGQTYDQNHGNQSPVGQMKSVFVEKSKVEKSGNTPNPLISNNFLK